jgi:acyl-CoA synthetase (AMP-forming)/AMP-acid ligase II
MCSSVQFLLSADGCRETDFSSMQCIVYGASPITEAILIDAMQTFGCEFVQGFGLTETTGSISVLEHCDHDPTGPRAHLLRSCGRPISTHDIKILDLVTGAEMPEGDVGEICVKGRQVMKDYWRDEKATRESFIDGWFRTGDAGYLKGGYLYIHDRVKDMIISGGENIYPAEIENVLMQHPLVADCAVIGVPSDRWGETVKAIVSRSDEGLSEQMLIEHCRKLLAAYKCPKSVDWTTDIPRKSSGKILKVELRKPYWKGKARQVS